MRVCSSCEWRMDCGMSALQLAEWKQKVVQSTSFRRCFHRRLCLRSVNIVLHPHLVILGTVSLQAHCGQWFWYLSGSLSGGQSFLVPSSLRGMIKGAAFRSTCHLVLPSRRLHKLYGEGCIWEEEMNFAIQCSYRTNCVCERVCLCMYFLIHFC